MTFIFITTWIALFIIAIRIMTSGWKAASELGGKQFINERKRYVTRTVHPEMRDVTPGTELLGVNFEKKTECDLEEYKALQQRIEELKSELEDPWDDEDDDGDVPALTNR